MAKKKQKREKNRLEVIRERTPLEHDLAYCENRAQHSLATLQRWEPEEYMRAINRLTLGAAVIKFAAFLETSHANQ